MEKRKYHIRTIYLILIFSFFIRIIYAATPFGWTSAGYIPFLKEYIREPSSLLSHEAGRIMYQGPIFYYLYGFLFKFSEAFNIPENIVSHVFSGILGTVSISLCYLIGKKFFNEKVGLSFSIMTSLFPVFWMITWHVNTEAISIFFILSAIYLIKRNFWSGILIGFSVLTRTDSLIVLIFILSYLVSGYIKNKDFKKFKKFLSGFFLSILPFIIFSLIFYNQIIPDLILEKVYENSYEYTLLSEFYTVLIYYSIFSMLFSIVYLLDIFKGRWKYFLLLSILIALFIPNTIIIRPSPTEFGFDETTSQAIMLILSFFGACILISCLKNIILKDGINRYLSIFIILFPLLWLVTTSVHLEPRYFVLIFFPITLLALSLSDKKQKIRNWLVFGNILIFLVAGAILNQWAVTSWNSIYDVNLYLKENLDSDERVFIYSTHGTYETVYFDELPYKTIRPDWYDVYVRDKNMIRYVVFDTADYFLVPSEIREFLNDRQDLLEKTIYVDLSLPPFLDKRINTIYMFNTTGVELPDFDQQAYASEYFAT